MDKIETLDRIGLAEILRLEASTILRLSSQSPERLPPSILLGGKRIWLLSSVKSWLQERQDAQQQNVQARLAEFAARPRRRGRPTKVEQFRRARAEVQS